LNLCRRVSRDFEERGRGVVRASWVGMGGLGSVDEWEIEYVDTAKIG
jgi:hypothetical protein